MRAFTVLLAGAAVLVAAPAGAADQKAGDLVFTGAQMRASLGQNPNTAAYLTIRNTGARPDRLMSASCACAAKAELHRTMVHGGKAMMMASGPVTVPAKGEIRLAPGGLHLMVMGLKAPLKAGTVQALTLRFERAGAVTVNIPVRATIAAAPATGHEGH